MTNPLRFIENGPFGGKLGNEANEIKNGEPKYHDDHRKNDIEGSFYELILRDFWRIF
jgi:hypothetical protein